MSHRWDTPTVLNTTTYIHDLNKAVDSFTHIILSTSSYRNAISCSSTLLSHLLLYIIVKLVVASCFWNKPIYVFKNQPLSPHPPPPQHTHILQVHNASFQVDFLNFDDDDEAERGGGGEGDNMDSIEDDEAVEG